MLPFLRDGDVLEIRPAPAAEIGIGDVICYEPPSGGLCLHRVVARDGRGFVTRGDALAYVEVVPAAAVLGRVSAVERRGRRLAARHPGGALAWRVIVSRVARRGAAAAAGASAPRGVCADGAAVDELTVEIGGCAPPS